MAHTAYYYDFRKPLYGGETNAQQLLEALQNTQPGYKSLSGYSSTYGRFYNVRYDVDCDEVFPNVYIGDGITARNKEYLKAIGITHVLNAAEGTRYGFVHTNKNFYRDTTIQYLGLQLADWPTTNISRYFYTVADFIDRAVAMGGKVYVHCVQGVSRSATCVLAYLMIKKGMRATDAIHIIRLSRDIYPNEGFLCQLATLDNALRRQRIP